MKRLLALLLCSTFALSTLHAESVVATPTPAALAAGGGELVLDVTIDYGAAPAALGLSLDLPKGWSLVDVAGEAKPVIVPDPGTTDKLDFAWLTAPAQSASFSITVQYPANAGGTILAGKAILRRDGKSLDLPLSVSLGG